MILDIHAAPPFMTNGFVLGCDATRAGVVIDPGDNVEALLEAARAHRLQITHILLTHAHLDHITGVAAAKAALHAPVWLHADDRALYDAIVEQGQMFGLRLQRQPAPDATLDPGATIAVGEHAIRVHHTPGHSPGGVCLEVVPGDDTSPFLIVGDTLFAGSIGRTDLPGGHLDTLLASIRTVLFSFPDDTVVYSGHGPSTTIGEERRSNPFLQ
jgi:hydroxyacylglutathione hydrolase